MPFKMKNTQAKNPEVFVKEKNLKLFKIIRGGNSPINTQTGLY